jgi:hypothetical protein
MKKLALLSILFCAAFAHGTACPTGYTGSVTLTIPSSGWGLSADLTNWPVVVLAGAATNSTGSGGFSQSTGLDVVFCDALSGGNLLSYELAPSTYSGSSAKGEWWVRVPTLSHTADTVIYAFIGKASDTDHSCGPSGLNNCSTTLWSAYKTVEHFGSTSTLSLTDSTGGFTVTSGGTTATTGQIGGAYIATSPNNSATFNATVYNTTITVELWRKGSCEVAGCSTHIWTSTQNSGQNGYIVVVNNSLGLYFYGQTTNFNISGVTCGNCSANNTFQHWAFQFNGLNPATVGNWHIYKNGSPISLTQQTTAISAWPATASLNLAVGQVATAGTDATDEFRIAWTVLSADWIKADYTEQNSPLSFGSSITGQRFPHHGQVF